VLSCCAMEKPTESATVVTTGAAEKPRRASVSSKDPVKDSKSSPRSPTASKKRASISGKAGGTGKEPGKSESGDAAQAVEKEKDTKASTSRRASIAKGAYTSEGSTNRRASVSKGTANSETSTNPKSSTSKSSRRASIAKEPEEEESKSPEKEKSSHGRRASTEKEPRPESKSRRASTEKETPSESPSAASKASPADSRGASPDRKQEEKADGKKRRASQEDSEAASQRDPSQPRVISAALAIVDPTAGPKPSEEDFVLLRPLPYEPVPWDGENHRQRSFIYKGSVFVVPMLAFHSKSEGAPPKSEGKEQKEDVRQGKGWKVVKSKVVGGAMKAE